MCLSTTTLEHAELWLKVAALAGAVVYFFFNVTNGFYVFSLGIKLKCDRRASSHDFDYLTIMAELKAGDVSTVELHDIQARVTYDVAGQSKQDVVSFAGIERPAHVRAGGRLRVAWGGKKRLRIRQGEEPHFSALVQVPKGAPCFVEIAVVGKRAFVGLFSGKWRASTHVL